MSDEGDGDTQRFFTMITLSLNNFRSSSVAPLQPPLKCDPMPSAEPYTRVVLHFLHMMP